MRQVVDYWVSDDNLFDHVMCIARTGQLYCMPPEHQQYLAGLANHERKLHGLLYSLNCAPHDHYTNTNEGAI
jgi:hypothetical protein